MVAMSMVMIRDVRAQYIRDFAFDGDVLRCDGTDANWDPFHYTLRVLLTLFNCTMKVFGSKIRDEIQHRLQAIQLPVCSSHLRWSMPSQRQNSKAFFVPMKVTRDNHQYNRCLRGNFTYGVFLA